MVLRPHWSYSQLSQYLRCPLQYFFERVAKLPRPFTPSGMILGSAVHEALAEYHRHLQAGQSVPAGHLADTFVAAWERREQERPIQLKNGQGRNGLIEQGVALVDLYQLEPPPQNILAIEQEIVVPLVTSDGEFLEKPLVAVLDLLHREETGLVVDEFKTSGKRFSEFEIDTALQATSYAYAVQEKFDEAALIRYVVLVRTKTPVVQRLETTRTDADRGRLGDVAAAVDRAIDAEAFYPIESPMNCSGCPFRLPCREWSGTARHKRVAAESPEQSEAALC